MSKPDPPQPPNPYATAAAQTGTNVSTGVANAMLNNVNQVTPQGNLSYDVTGNYSWTDPATGSVYQIPRFTATQTQTPVGQNIEASNNQTKLNLATIGSDQSSKIGSILSNPFAPLGAAPAGGDPAWTSMVNSPPAQTGYDTGGQIQSSFGDAGQIRGADDFSADRQRVEESLMARMNPQLARERGNIEQRLADQGIRYGSQAYASAMDDYNRQSTDARFGAISQAGQEQARMVGMSQAAQQQMYDQLMGRGSFANQAQAQQNAQNAALAGFGNAGRAQQLAQNQSTFNAYNAARNQYLQEQYQQRSQPLNEIAALATGSQVQNPNWLNTPSSQIATTDFANIMNQNFAQQSQNYQSANQAWSSTMGGLLGLGAGALRNPSLSLSDKTMKENIVPMGTVFAAGDDGERKKLPISEWSYKGDPARHVGPMAQDVEKIDKGAVKTIGGKKHIDPRRVMGNILRAA